VTADADLVRRCLADETAALRELVERFQNDVHGLCYRLLRHSQDTEDVAQEVFIRVFRSLGRWDATRPLRPWIMGIAVNRCRTAMGKRLRRPETVDYLAETAATEEPKDDAPEVAAAIREAVDACGTITGRSSSYSMKGASRTRRSRRPWSGRSAR